MDAIWQEFSYMSSCFYVESWTERISHIYKNTGNYLTNIWAIINHLSKPSVTFKEKRKITNNKETTSTLSIITSAYLTKYKMQSGKSLPYKHYSSLHLKRSWNFNNSQMLASRSPGNTLKPPVHLTGNLWCLYNEKRRQYINGPHIITLCCYTRL